ncbi:MAG: hypothetical protein ACRDRW_18375 [Pseudonocardiaceae bacterium]
MTGPQLDPDGPWVQVDLAAQPREWAAGTVSRRWAAQRLDPDQHRAEVITGGIARIVGALDTAALDEALLLYPAADEPVVAVVGLRSFPAPPGFTLEALGEELCVPEEMLERPRQCSVVKTPTGPAVRLVQRYREPISPEAAEIRDHVAYGWLVAQTTVVVASTAFVDLVAAGTWITAVDERFSGRTHVSGVNR